MILYELAKFIHLYYLYILNDFLYNIQKKDHQNGFYLVFII